MTTNRPTTDRPARWRNYSDLSPAEKAAVRRKYAAGDAVMRIAQGCRVYAGTIVTAAERGQWRRLGGAVSVGQRIAAALGRHPAWSDPEIARLVGCDPSYVHTVRWRLRAKSKAGAK